MSAKSARNPAVRAEKDDITDCSRTVELESVFSRCEPQFRVKNATGLKKLDRDIASVNHE